MCIGTTSIDVFRITVMNLSFDEGKYCDEIIA